MWKQHLLSSLRRGLGPVQTPTASTKTTTAFSPRASRLRPQPGKRWNSSNATGQQKQHQSRTDRILARLPASMQKYTAQLRSAPLSHVVAFLILHEVTTALPFFGLFGLFHYTDYVPLGYLMEHYGSLVQDGTDRFEGYFRRKGWFGFSQGGGGEEGEEERRLRAEGGDEGVMDRWASPDGKYRTVVEVALSYAITKVLLPARIMASLWMTPWFAGVMVRMRRALPGAGKSK